MRTSSFFAPLFLAAYSLAQAVEEGIEPASSAPAGCETSVKGNFTIGVENFFAPRSKRETAQQAADGALLCTLEDGVLRDQYSRTGSVVANRQFQFDGPPQAGAIYTGGFSICKNNSLAIGGTTRWWRCMSGAFGNLYDESIGEQCTEIRIVVDLLDEPSSSSSLAPSTSSTLSLISTNVPVSARSSSATSLSSDASSLSNSTATRTGSSSPSTPSATESGSGSASGSATRTASGSSSPTASGAAPPAAEGSATASSLAYGAILGALLTIAGAALVL